MPVSTSVRPPRTRMILHGPLLAWSIAWSPTVLQSQQATIGVSGGVVSAFEVTGGYLSLTVMPVTLRPAEDFQLRFGVEAWGGRTSTATFSDAERELVSVGSRAEVRLKPGSVLSPFARLSVDYMKTTVSYGFSIGPLPGPIEDHDGSSGWGVGGEAGVSVKATSHLWIQLGAAVTTQQLYTYRKHTLWRYGVGVATGFPKR